MPTSLQPVHRAVSGCPDPGGHPALDDLPDGVVVADADGRVTAVNAAAQRLLGAPVEPGVGAALEQVLPLVDAQGRDWWRCTRPFDGLPSRTRQPEALLTLPSGVQLLVTASYVRGADRRLERVVVCLRDDRARERLERSRANLVSTVAHELRSPLTTVKGYTKTLLARWDRLTDAHKRLMLEAVNADADRVTRLITDLLDVSRIDAGRLEMRPQVVDLLRAARRAVAGAVAGGADAERFVVRERGSLPEMWADPDKVDQVLGNLVENALRHGAGTVTVAVSALADDGGAEVTVDDEGPGVPDQIASRVFTRFWRGGDRRHSTGLGLYIVKGLVEAHGGAVSVGRAPSGGARFRFVLPAGTPPFL